MNKKIVIGKNIVNFSVENKEQVLDVICNMFSLYVKKVESFKNGSVNFSLYVSDDEYFSNIIAKYDLAVFKNSHDIALDLAIKNNCIIYN